MEAVMWHGESCSQLFIQMFLLVWFEASVFYYTIDAGLSLELLLIILLLPFVVEILQPWVFWIFRTNLSMCSSRS